MFLIKFNKCAISVTWNYFLLALKGFNEVDAWEVKSKMMIGIIFEFIDWLIDN